VRKYLLGLAVTLVVAAYQLKNVPLFTLFDDVERDIFAILLSLAAVIICLDYYVQRPVKFIRLFALMIFSYNLIDEVFVNPYVYGMYEYITAIIMAITSFATYAVRKFDNAYA